MIIAVLEWNSDKGITPIVLVANDPASARLAALKAISEHLPNEDDTAGNVNCIDEEWVAANPLPALDNDEAVTAWLAAFAEATTDLWLNLYGKGQGTTEDTYVETRTAVFDGFAASVRDAYLTTNGGSTDTEAERERLAQIVQVVLDVEEKSKDGDVVTCRECSRDLDGSESATCDAGGKHVPDQEPTEPSEGEPQTRSIDLALRVTVPNDGYDYSVDVTGRIEELLSLLLLHPKVSSAGTRSGTNYPTGSGYDGESVPQN